MIRIVLVALIVVSSALAQVTPKPTTKKSSELDAEELLKAVDQRIYYACENGLKSFRFRMSIDHGTGTFDGPLKGLYMAVSWQAPKNWRVDLVDAKGDAASNLPEILATKDGKKVLQAWQTELKGMALHLIVGLPLHKKYAKHLKKVKVRYVNNKREYKITMHPDRKRSYSELVLRIVGGLPRELIQITAKGDRFISRFSFSKREKHGGKNLWVGVEQESQSVKTREEEYEYLTKDGLLVLSRLKRLDYMGALPKVNFKIEDLVVNPKFPKGFFLPKKAAN